MSTSTLSLITLINPIGNCETTRISLARRLDSLHGKSLGFIDNIKPNAGLFLQYIEEMIRGDYHDVQIHKVRKNFTPNLLIADKLDGKVDAVINAWGD